MLAVILFAIADGGADSLNATQSLQANATQHEPENPDPLGRFDLWILFCGVMVMSLMGTCLIIVCALCMYPSPVPYTGRRRHVNHVLGSWMDPETDLFADTRPDADVDKRWKALVTTRTQQAVRAEDLEEPVLEVECSICLCVVAEGEVIATLPCQHEFHLDCISPWLRKQTRESPAAMHPSMVVLAAMAEAVARGGSPTGNSRPHPCSGLTCPSCRADIRLAPRAAPHGTSTRATPKRHGFDEAEAPAAAMVSVDGASGLASPPAFGMTLGC